jgi:hypothetical protein
LALPLLRNPAFNRVHVEDEERPGRDHCGRRDDAARDCSRRAIGVTGTMKPASASRVCYGGNKPEENIMPVILLWGIPALIVIGGGSYWLIHLHH